MRTLAPLLLLTAACGPIVAVPPPTEVTPPPADAGGGIASATHWTFAWDNGSIFGGESLEVGIAEGSQSAISVSPGLDGVSSVGTSDASVAVFEISGANISVVAHAPGTADLILLDARGAEIVRAPVRVAATTQLAFPRALPDQKLIVYDGSPVTFHVSTVGPGGEATVGVGGVAFSSTGAAQLDSFSSIWGDGDSMDFSGYGGEGTVTARSPHASATLDVEFVAPTEVVSITPSIVHEDGYTDVRFVSSTADGAVYGAWPDCTSSVQEIGTGVTGIDQLPYAFYRYLLDGHGSFTLSCKLGAHKLAVPVSY